MANRDPEPAPARVQLSVEYATKHNTTHQKELEKLLRGGKESTKKEESPTHTPIVAEDTMTITAKEVKQEKLSRSSAYEAP